MKTFACIRPDGMTVHVEADDEQQALETVRATWPGSTVVGEVDLA